MTIADELQKLEQMHESGSLSHEEFQRAKEKLMREDPGQEALHAPPNMGLIDLDEECRKWAVWLHLSQFAYCIVPVIGLILPVVLWQSKADKMPGIAPHGRMVLNWAISIHIYAAALFAVVWILNYVSWGCCFFVWLTLVPIYMVAIAWPIIGAIVAKGGRLWKYRWAISFFNVYR